MQVSKWGNSLAVRLPAAVVDALGLVEGDDIEIAVAGDRQFEVTKAASRDDLLVRLRAKRGLLPAGFTFDRLEAHGRGEDRGVRAGRDLDGGDLDGGTG